MRIKGYRPLGLPAVLAGISIFLNLAFWVLVLATFPKHDPSAILHYTAGVGVDFVGSGWQIFVLPIIGLIMLVLNAVLARLVQSASNVAYWVFWASLPLIEALLIGTYIILLRLNS
ncbi:MAG: hypothetical protein A3E36_02200 [Candidatus Andersenbacteria bacterium RIFCSPHIGHO2_12_FULL_45_11b]|uniref:DUF1648 domain-containing protein n=1 Tax=Candidatus Andersenbacteria bacterium RIFCSPHIGHO2_12_FULL_45_11b TaxID=1797282 RepID=A0A1G1XD09_9BACT|nr:MAG: hypothetical protein A3E36_02200 [Candidatus Andersenbacteria bacterium RIFCSPHIGHO2_12_FULL_45_11b]